MEHIFNLIMAGLVVILTILFLGILSGIVFYFVYNPLAPKWLYFIPQQFQSVGFWESIGLFILTGLIGRLIQNFVPSFCSKGK